MDIKNRVYVTIPEFKPLTKEEIFLRFEGHVVTEITFLSIVGDLEKYYHRLYVDREIPTMPSKFDIEVEVKTTFPDFVKLDI